jgi:hypothetical protein
VTHLRWAAVLGVLVVAVAACGGNAPTVRSVDAEVAGSVEDLESGVGADLDASRSSVATTTTALDSASQRVLKGAAALLDGFFGALRAGDFATAKHYTAGPALQFLSSLEKTAACGLGVTEAQTNPPSDVKIGEKGSYRLMAESSITFSTGVTQTFEAIAIDVPDDGSWRIFDLLVDEGTSVNAFLVSPLPPELEFDKLRMLLVDACFAPDKIQVTVDLESGSDFRTEFLETYLRLPNGDRVDPTGGGLGVLAQPLPAHATRRWSVEFERPALGGIATIVLVTVDTEGKSIGLPRDRLYPIKMAPIFADVVAGQGSG